MNKTLHKTFPKHNANISPTVNDTPQCDDELTALTHSMRNILKQAATDLMQPRAALIEELLKKVGTAKLKK